ncbi:MAG: ribbon-helix-helix domain-containing protein [Acidobacteriota bacterium]
MSIDWNEILGTVRTALSEEGIELECGTGPDTKGARVKVAFVTPGLKDSVDAMGQQPREHVVMVRVDEPTLQDLDAWVEAGAVKSRSEAAALFIREGLRVRSDELERLREALAEVESAREKLKEKAKEVFG